MTPIMPRNGKLTAFVLVTVCVAGCAKPNDTFSVRKPQLRGKQPRAGVDSRRIKDAKSLKIRPETHLAAGRMFESRGQLPKALAQYRKAVAVNSRNVGAYHRLGLLASRAGSRKEAIKAFRRAVKLKPKDAVLRNNLGFELLSAKRFAEAERELAEAVKLEPTFARAQVNFGILQCKLGRFDEGLASFLTVLPEADAFYNLGLMYRGQKRYVEAARAFRQVLVIEPGFTAAVTQIEKMKEHMPRARLPRPAPKFAARTLGKRPAVVATVPSHSRPDARPRHVTPAPNRSPKRATRDDSQQWAGTFAMLDKALGSSATVDAFPMTDVPPALLEGYPLEDMTALEEIANNERDCLRQEADLRAEATENQLDAAGAMAWADDAQVIACEAIELCDAGDPPWNGDGQVGTHTSPASYGSTEPTLVEARRIAPDMTEWNLVPLRVAEENVSSVDSLALLRALEDELAIVRNDIECVDQNARLASATARRAGVPPSVSHVRPNAGVPARSNSLIGPPAALLASQPRKAGSPRDRTQVDVKQRGGKANKKRSRRTRTSQATPTGKDSRTAVLRGTFGHEPGRRPN